MPESSEFMTFTAQELSGHLSEPLTPEKLALRGSGQIELILLPEQQILLDGITHDLSGPAEDALEVALKLPHGLYECRPVAAAFSRLTSTSHQAAYRRLTKGFSYLNDVQHSTGSLVSAARIQYPRALSIFRLLDGLDIQDQRTSN